MDKQIKRRNHLLLVAYLAVTALCLLPALGLGFNTSQRLLGVPVSVLWLTACFTGLALLTGIGYVAVFRPWSRKADAITGKPDATEDKR